MVTVLGEKDMAPPGPTCTIAVAAFAAGEQNAIENEKSARENAAFRIARFIKLSSFGLALE
jgi:hypothetical protein